MELTTFTDYSLRVLIYAALHRDRLVSVSEIADAYNRISRHHVVKVVNRLSNLGYIETIRGKGGGFCLRYAPDQINIGEVVRKTEPHFALVPCMNGGSGGCVINGCCMLKHALDEARDGFLKILGKYTLADVTQNRLALLKRL